MIRLFVDLTASADPMKIAVIVKAAITEINVSFVVVCLLLTAVFIFVLQNVFVE